MRPSLSLTGFFLVSGFIINPIPYQNSNARRQKAVPAKSAAIVP
jgi:hypothetical protein